MSSLLKGRPDCFKGRMSGHRRKTADAVEGQPFVGGAESGEAFGSKALLSGVKTSDF